MRSEAESLPYGAPTDAPVSPPESWFTFAGQNWRPLPQGALYWRERRALIVADLHFEKASAYAFHGQMLPPYDSRATLDCLEAIMADIDPREVWCLGDSFHDIRAQDRMLPETADRIVRLVRQCRWTWITGNHDPNGAGKLGGRCVDEETVDGVILRHEADSGEPAPEISGHFHPKLRMRLRGCHVYRRCFALGATKLIVPAFGALTGGLDVGSPVVRALIGGRAEALVPLDSRLLRFPISV